MEEIRPSQIATAARDRMQGEGTLPCARESRYLCRRDSSARQALPSEPQTRSGVWWRANSRRKECSTGSKCRNSPATSAANTCPSTGWLRPVKTKGWCRIDGSVRPWRPPAIRTQDTSAAGAALSPYASSRRFGCASGPAYNANEGAIARGLLASHKVHVYNTESYQSQAALNRIGIAAKALHDHLRRHRPQTR